MSRITIFLAITALVSYLLGGVNGSIIASLNFFKRDVRNYGSGNAGLTNFARTFGANGIVMVVLVDVLKTIAAVMLGRWLLGMAGYPMIGKLFASFCTMFGHVYPLYYRLRGGKAVLCAGTLVWMTDWRVALICWAVFLIVVTFTRYVSLGAIIGALLFPIGLWAFGYSGLEGLLGLFCALVLAFAHRENIKNLRNGTENKLSFGGSPRGR
ncbi:MAG: glycerol-3-phosphate acyltransferase [Oscillospiraceae bacterium]|jgi:glycerol-3-phosphate acyltransferase PlsY|nr:glycerol-3-phosphate acyltransferase [Oscillospiraceae bacterium]